MPTALPAIKLFVVKFFTAKAIGYVIARTILTNLVLGAISRKLTSKQRQGAPPINVTIRGTVENRRLIFGTRRTGGVMAFYGVSSTGGSTNDLLWYVIVLAGHQVSAITDIYIDARRIANADIDAGTGAVTAGDFAGKVWVWKHLGTQAQTVDANIDPAFTEWTTNHRLRGCAYIVVQMKRDDNVFSQGAPQGVSAVVDGALVYDSRLDSTNGGSGSHRYTDPQTWAFSRNPALHTRWYQTGGSVVNDNAVPIMRYGLREPATRIDEAYFVAAANECDETLSGANAPPSGSQTRYLCDLEVSCGESRRDILEALLATMAGTLTNEHGKWRLFAGAYDTPAHTLTQDDLYGDLECQDTDPHPQRYNAVSATYVDAEKQWVEQTTPFRTDEDYETQDGGERIPREIDLRGVTNQYQAQRLAEIELRKSRMMRAIKMVGALNLLKVAKHETFTLTHSRYGWTNRVYRCLERQFEFNQEAGRVTITARQEDAGVYTDMLTADYTTGTSDTDVFTYELPDPPVSLTATSLPLDVLLTVGLPGVLHPGSIVEIWEHTASTPFASATKVAESLGTKIGVPHQDTTTRYYWATIRNSRGVRSTEYPVGGGVAGAAAFIGTGDLNSDAVTELYSGDVDFGAGDSPPSSSSNKLFNLVTFTPAASGTIILSAQIEGKSTLDKDSGDYVGLGLNQTANLGSTSGNYTLPGTGVVYGGFIGLDPVNTRISIFLAHEFAVTGGVQYTAGCVVREEFGTVTLYTSHLRVLVKKR